MTITDWCKLASAHPDLFQYRVRGSITTAYAGSEQVSNGNEVEGRAPRATEADRSTVTDEVTQSIPSLILPNLVRTTPDLPAPRNARVSARELLGRDCTCETLFRYTRLQILTSSG